MRVSKFSEYITESSGHSYYVPSYDECRQICDSNGNLLFYESKHKVDGYDISIFNYRLAQPANFETPIEGNSKIKAHELRGLTFVFDRDGSLFDRYVMLDKFWNMNQSPCSMYSIVKDYKIKSVYNKEDGSIASFVKLPNGRVIARSKTSFISEQAVEIQKIYDRWPNVRQFVNFCFDKNIVPIFEYVAPTNRIVVPYANTDLILLRMRDNRTGEYLDLADYSDRLDGITVAPSMDHSLEELVELKDVIEGKEGWIVQFENGKMVKIKTLFYTERHGLLTEDIYREHIIIGYILDDKIDDILGQIPEDEKEAHDRINKIVSVVRSAITDKVSEIKKSYTIFLNTESVKEYALRYRKDPNFGFVMSVYRGVDPQDLAEKWVRDNTKRLFSARQWLSKMDPSICFDDGGDN